MPTGFDQTVHATDSVEYDDEFESIVSFNPLTPDTHS